ncbi:MAG: 23S rRNA (uracil(1939)-C(5))-methyltransferase RlmD [Clostridia bacterium]|nr:23S rRNA (uracil(1939)-C(5))-methyltransferase RlmD [Clostridia bacterium]
MRKNDVLSLVAENLGAEMEGVCRHDGMAVFVPGLLPGEKADVRIVRVEKRYAFGRLESAPEVPSPSRRPSDCPAYPQCGGCTARHMTYAATLEAKRQHVLDCFARIGHLSVEVPPVLGMEDPLCYRNKTALPAGGTAEAPLLGFFAPRSHRLVPAVHCPNAMRPTERIAEAVLAWMRQFRIAPYDEATGQGLLRHLVVRINRKQEAMATLVVNGKTLPHAAELSGALAPLGVVSLYMNENTRRTNVIFGDRFRLLSGEETLTDTLCGLTFDLSPASFFQVNPRQTETLYATALAFADLRLSDTLCDVYCGAGTITLMMARHCRQAVGVEIVPSAVENARQNARRNGVPNVLFHEGKAEDLLPEMVRDGLRPNVIVVDPPRKGLELPVIEAIAEAKPDRLVYVSCNPATQARDAALLKEKGFLIQKIQPVDMFPFTSHVETVLLMSQQKPDDTIHVGIDLKPEDVTVAESKATYAELQAYIEEKYSFKVSNLYIAQAKAALGIKERENYNKPKNPNSKKLVCPPDKMAAIQEALSNFKMI